MSAVPSRPSRGSGAKSALSPGTSSAAPSWRAGRSARRTACRRRCLQDRQTEDTASGMEEPQQRFSSIHFIPSFMNRIFQRNDGFCVWKQSKLNKDMSLGGEQDFVCVGGCQYSPRKRSLDGTHVIHQTDSGTGYQLPSSPSPPPDSPLCIAPVSLFNVFSHHRWCRALRISPLC